MGLLNHMIIKYLTLQEKCQTVPQSGWTILHSHQQPIWDRFILRSQQCWGLSGLLFVAFPVGMWWYLTVALACNFLMRQKSIYAQKSACHSSCLSGLLECEWKWKSLRGIWLFVTPWPKQSMEFSRPEYWSGLPFPSPGHIPNPRIKPRSPTLQVDSLPAEPQSDYI